VAVVEKRATHGGTCLNIGCIPSKALLHSSELYGEAGHSFARMGIGVSPTLDLKQMMVFKQEAIDGNTKGVDFLFRKNKITAHRGTARILGPGKVEVKPDEGDAQILDARTIVIATGSDSAKLKGIDIDERQIVSSTGALALAGVPGHLLVIGAGVIGLELGSVWRRLGAQVTVVEFLDGVLPGVDGEVRRQAQRLFEKRNHRDFRADQRVAMLLHKARLKRIVLLVQEEFAPGWLLAEAPRGAHRPHDVVVERE
jgi:dihydrolipoamide dehydrogenase